ncbi:hypothetical protein ACHQM5_018877 [Ranunculus cassubicifolius]
MDNYITRSSPPPPHQDPIPRRRNPWKRLTAELDGRFSLKYHREASALLLESYAEVGAFPHFYHIGEEQCSTFMNRVINAASDPQAPPRREGVSGLEFDSKGIYLASVTKSGCLMVQDFETLYCLSDGPISCPKEDESKHVVHISTGQQLDVVRWNVANQDEVACTSTTSNEVRIFDIGYVSSDPVEILQKKPTVTVHGYKVPRGLSDIAFSPMDKSRLFASDMYGVINIWDRRTSNLPCVELTTNSRAPLNSIQLSTDNQIIYGAGKNGIVYAWDLRGGRTSTSMAFQNYKDVSHPPLTSLKLAPMLQKIQSLSAQSEIVPREIYSIDLDPSAPYQLAFHLNNGWSGVINIKSSEVTHIHCPPPAWLSDRDTSMNFTYIRKPAWLPTGSIYAVGSTSVDGIHLLDFYPSAISACHVDFNEEMEKMPTDIMQNRFVQTSDDITVCCCHPLNGSIIAGTKQSSLLMISAKSVHRGSHDS